MQLDAPRTIYDHPANAFVANFIGESTLLPVDFSTGVPSFDGRELRVPNGNGRGDQLLMLRPEKLVLVPPDQEAEYNLFRGTLKDLVFQGESFLMYVDIGDTEVAVRSVSQRQFLRSVPAVGGEVTLGLHPDETVLVPGTQVPGE